MCTCGAQLATVTPSHRVIDFFFVSRDFAGACEATTHLSLFIARHRPVIILVSTLLIQPRKRVMNRPKPWPAERPAGVAVATCSLGAERHEFASTFSLLDSDWMIPCWENRRTDHARTVGLVHELLVLAVQAHKLAAVLVSLILCARRQTFWKHRLRTIATVPDWMIRIMEAEASGLANQALRVQQQAACRSWRACLEENTTAGAAKVLTHPISFQAARGNVVDEQLKLHGQPFGGRLWNERSLARRRRARFSTDHQWTRCAGCSHPFARSLVLGMTRYLQGR